VIKKKLHDFNLNIFPIQDNNVTMAINRCPLKHCEITVFLFIITSLIWIIQGNW